MTVMPTNIFSANSKHLQTGTNIYDVLMQIFVKLL